MEHSGHPDYPHINGAIPHSLLFPGPSHPHHAMHHHQMTPIMDRNHQHQPSDQLMYGASNYGPITPNLYGPKRKPMRATRACEHCRQRKRKCDQGILCSFCKENSLSCQYRDKPPAKPDKNLQNILAHMETHSHSLRKLIQRIETFEARLPIVQDHIPCTMSYGSNSNHHQHIKKTTAGAQWNALSVEESSQQLKPHVEDHRTAPHKLLLLWPTIHSMLTEANVQQNDSYVMEAEDRDILRIWTRGEGIDEYDGTQPGGPVSPGRSGDSGDDAGNDTLHTDGLWGVDFPATPASGVQRSEPMSAEGRLNALGRSDLDARTLSDLYSSYIRHIHIMHPFLDGKGLKKMFDNFTQRYGTSRPRATFAVGTKHDVDQRPLKRQRSNGASAGPENGSEPRSVQTERSPGNAIVYLVLALGKICMHRNTLPGIVQDSELQANANVEHEISSKHGMPASSPLSGSIKPSPSSPKSRSTTHPTHPSKANQHSAESRSRIQSIGGSPSFGMEARNSDIIPGIAYFAKAAEILGDQADGNDLAHAQMFLLAGLYKGQLARVKESMSWITMAGRVIRNLLNRYNLWNENYWTAFGDKAGIFAEGQLQVKDARQSLIVLTAWTCLQLESDILAELKFPESGIQQDEQRLLMPHPISEDEYRDRDNVLLFYTSQLFLRRRLNMIHRELYGAYCLSLTTAEVQEILKGHEEILRAWREHLPPNLRWNDEDDPPQNILAARLRAKYWGAKYLISRPYLDYALHVLPHLHTNPNRPIEEIAKDGHDNPRDKADIRLFCAIRSMGDEEVFLAVSRCIYAAQKSTVAFDGVAPRLIVTNIHGTAHAQFGNILVLAAAYRSRYVRRCVDERMLKKLMDRTILFLRGLTPMSPTCLADYAILEKLKNILFPLVNDAPDVYRNEDAEPKSSNSDPMSADM